MKQISKKLTSLLLLTVQPLIIFPNIVPDGKTNVYVETSSSGTPIVNISTPSSKGISHSTFKNFSTDNHGVIINNDKTTNKNIKQNEAKVALLDVTGTSKSVLQGIIKANSKEKLNVILSNENGITLDGTKFINIHNMTLTTSKVK